MIVPTQCQENPVACDPANPGKVSGKTQENALCQNLKTQAENMEAVGVCSNSVTDGLLKFTNEILSECGKNINEQVDKALNCTLNHCDDFNQEPEKGLQANWKIQMEICLFNSKPGPGPYNYNFTADLCLVSARPLDCISKPDNFLCPGFKEIAKAWEKVCQQEDKIKQQSDRCMEKKWTTPSQLDECFKTLECTSKESKQKLTGDQLGSCFRIEEDADQLKTKLNNCFKRVVSNTTQANTTATLANTTPATATSAPNTINPSDQDNKDKEPTSMATPASNTINPSDQDNKDKEPTSMAPQDQDVTSGEEDEGCMVRANKKIIIAFAATFVLISFLKALPVKN